MMSMCVAGMGVCVCGGNDKIWIWSKVKKSESGENVFLDEKFFLCLQLTGIFGGMVWQLRVESFLSIEDVGGLYPEM